MKDPEIMREIHRIRERFYEEEKNLTTKEKIAKIKKEAQLAVKKYGFRFKKHHSLASS